MTLRVIQWHTGSTGARALEQVIAHRELELVGVLVHSEDKAGRDAGDLVGAPPTGVTTTTDKRSLIELDADVVLHNTRWTPDMSTSDGDVVALLESGKDVISVVSGYMCPWAVDRQRALRFVAACERGGSTLFGTGLAHGLTDWLAVMLTGISASLREIRYTERFDRSDSPRPYAVLEVMGMGKPASEFTPDSPRGALYFHKLLETAAVIAAGLGTSVRSAERGVRLGFADRDIDIPAGTIARGTVAAVAWSLRAELESGPLVTITGQRSAAPVAGWDTTTGWTIEVEGDPSSRVDLHLAPSVLGFSAGEMNADTNVSEIRATAAAQIRAIREVVVSPPGIMLPRFFATWSGTLRAPPTMWDPASGPPGAS